MSALFQNNQSLKPLAEEIRPSSLEEIFGQEHLFSSNSQIMQMMSAAHVQNIIFWGPPGSGKTTIARILAKQCKYHIESISAVINATSDIKQIFNNGPFKQQMQHCHA